MTVAGLVFNIQRFSVHDGPGIRTTVFMKGCPLACTWCHNPESQELSPRVVRLSHRCMQCGRCSQEELASPVVIGRDECDVDACPTGALQMVGERITSSHLVARLLRDRVFFDESHGGVTISGGEPLVQAPFVVDVLRHLRFEGVHTALDTCGFAPWESLHAAAVLSDLVLFDLKVMDPARHEAATGVGNERILRNLRALADIHPGIWIRLPVIPGVNDDQANMAATVEFLCSLPRPLPVSLLPYHPTGEAKFARLGKHYGHHGAAVPARDQLNTLAAHFHARGLTTTIGGQAA